VRLLERLDASKLSLCVIRHVRRTGGRVLRWLATISHTALIVLVLVVIPVLPPGCVPCISLHLTRVVSLARDKRVSFLLSLLCFPPSLSLSLSLFLSISRSTFMRCVFHMALCWLLPFSRLLSVSASLSLYLSIVHNYTIRLLNRLMRPPLPVVATPFTETTGRARASLLSLPLLFRLAHVLEILKLSPTYPLAYFFPARVCPLACPDFLTRALPALRSCIILLLISVNAISNTV